MPRLRLILASIVMLVCLAPAGAGIGETPACEGDCRRVVADAVQQYFDSVVPVLSQPSENFAAASEAACGNRGGAGPQVFGVLIGPQYQGNLALKGPENDTQLMRQVMVERGATESAIVRLTGETVTRAEMLKAMGGVLPCLRERDQVVFHYSGHSAQHDWDYFSQEWFTANSCAEPADEAIRAVCDMATADAEKDEQAAAKQEVVKAAFHDAVQPYDQLLLIDSSTLWTDEEGIAAISGLTAAELANFVTRVRNRGADIFVIIDTNFAASADVLGYERDAAVAPGWSADSATLLAENGLPDPVAAQNDQGTVPLFGSGEFAAFYATAADKKAVEDDQKGQGFFGSFSFAMAEALRGEGRLTFRDLALAVSDAFKDQDYQTPVFQASNADLAFLAPRAEPAPADDKSIAIISPALKRGAAAVEERSFTLVARYTGNAKVFKAIVDGDIVDVDGNGQFRKEITDTGGKLALSIRVLAPDLTTLAATSLKLREADEVAPIVSAAGRRVALVIANDTYQNAAFPSLKTPLADAKAVADLLTGKYGFVTSLKDGKAPLELFLTNATKAQIQQTLFELRRRLTAEDQLLVYYAGHGESDPELGAYWVPVDGLPKEDFTWLAADEITRELKRMNALSVLVISDSCYAGGLSRGAADEAPPAAVDARGRWLAKAARLKSRQLMASGGNEPVSDSGGSGHSVFAKALIDALGTMPEKTFTASELFEQKVKPAVIAAANALSEGQTPGYHRIGRAGDEPGSEFIFAAAASSP
jgi:uncharacterized caspase-like protein